MQISDEAPGTDRCPYQNPNVREVLMPVFIGAQAPDSTWPIAWQNGSAVTDGSTISLSSCLGKVVMLYLTDSGEG